MIMNIIDLNKKEIGHFLSMFMNGNLEKSSVQKLIRFVEFNHQMLEIRIASLWGKDSMISIYTGLILGLEMGLDRDRDIRFANVLLKLSTTNVHKKLLKSGAIKKSHADILNEDLV